MIDEEGNGIGLVAPVDSGRCGAIGESHSSTTAAPPAARPDAPQGAALDTTCTLGPSILFHTNSLPPSPTPFSSGCLSVLRTESS